MRVVPNLAQEFEDVCAEYLASGDPMGRDIVTLVKMFGDEYDHIRSDGTPDYRTAWTTFLDEHKHQMVVTPMVGLVLYYLITYWEDGQVLGVQLPTLERMLVRDTVSEISDEIHRRSAANGPAVLAAED